MDPQSWRPIPGVSLVESVVMTGLVFALLLSATTPLHEHAFRLDREAEAVAAVTASC